MCAGMWVWLIHMNFHDLFVQYISRAEVKNIQANVRRLVQCGFETSPDSQLMNYYNLLMKMQLPHQNIMPLQEITWMMICLAMPGCKTATKRSLQPCQIMTLLMKHISPLGNDVIYENLLERIMSSIITSWKKKLPKILWEFSISSSDSDQLICKPHLLKTIIKTCWCKD